MHIEDVNSSVRLHVQNTEDSNQGNAFNNTAEKLTAYLANKLMSDAC